MANLKYLGLNALGEMVKENPTVAATHQAAVMNCLQSDDEALRRKAIDLLFAISNENNVQVVIEKMLDFLKKTTDEYFQIILINRINDLAGALRSQPLVVHQDDHAAVPRWLATSSPATWRRW